jgi:L-amino acid N-acyltransferase YncA
MKIRKAASQDYDGVWEIFEQVVRAGETYVFDPETPKVHLAHFWFAPNLYPFVLESEGKILGTYVIKANQVGLGSHIANGSYMVHPDARGLGVGGLLCEHSLNEARSLGFRAMQFNLVVSTNADALKLWKKFDFEIIGTIPEAFRHKQFGYVDGYIMYRKL